MRCLVIALALLLAACEAGPGPPKLIQNARLDAGDISAGFTQRLDGRFPSGTPEDRLVAGLRADGFAVDRITHTAKRDWTRFPCANYLTVRWRIDASGGLTGIEGGYQYTCV